MNKEKLDKMKELLDKVDESVIEYNNYIDSLKFEDYTFILNYEPIFWAKKFLEENYKNIDISQE